MKYLIIFNILMAILFIYTDYGWIAFINLCNCIGGAAYYLANEDLKYQQQLAPKDFPKPIRADLYSK